MGGSRDVLEVASGGLSDGLALLPVGQAENYS